MYNILIVEDDFSMRREIADNLHSWGFSSLLVDDFKDVLSIFIREKPDLILLDVNLPYYNGFYWCQKIREISKIPIIFISSRDTNMDVIMALNNGADDYITKPFSMPILIGKIQALYRRAYDYSSGANQEKMNILQHNELILKMNESVAFIREQKIDLTKNELKILSLLMKNKGKIITRVDLMTLLWDEDFYVNDNTLTVNINRLRAKLDEAGLPDFISTKKGQGYVIL